MSIVAATQCNVASDQETKEIQHQMVHQLGKIDITETAFPSSLGDL